MKKEEYILFSELSDKQKEFPGIFPVFKKIHKVDGQVKGYSDSFGNPLPEHHSERNTTIDGLVRKNQTIPSE